MHRKKRGLESAFLVADEAQRDDKKRIRRIRKDSRRKERASLPKKEALKDSRVTVAQTHSRGESYSNSSTFFSNLQDQVKNGINVTKMKQKQLSDDSKSLGRTSQGLKL